MNKSKDSALNRHDFGKGPCTIHNMVSSFRIGNNTFINLKKLGLYFRKELPFSYSEPKFAAANISIIGVNEDSRDLKSVFNCEDQEWYDGLMESNEDEVTRLTEYLYQEVKIKKYMSEYKIFDMKCDEFPPTTFIIFNAGNVIQSGHLTKEQGLLSALKMSCYINKALGIPSIVSDYRVRNIVMSINFKGPFDLYGIADSLPGTAVYDPTRFPAVRISDAKIGDPKRKIKILWYRSGAAICMGASNMIDIKRKYDEMHMIAEKFKDEKTKHISHAEYKTLGAKNAQKKLKDVNDKLQDIVNPTLMATESKKAIEHRDNIIKSLKYDLASTELLKSSDMDDILKLVDKYGDDDYIRTDLLEKNEDMVEYEDDDDDEYEDDDDITEDDIPPSDDNGGNEGNTSINNDMLIDDEEEIIVEEQGYI